MRRAEIEHVNANLSEIGDHLAYSLGVSPGYVDQWACRTKIIPLIVSKNGTYTSGWGPFKREEPKYKASISFENGEPVGVESYWESDINEIQGHEGALCLSGLGRFASIEAQQVLRFRSPEVSVWGVNGDEAKLHFGFINSAGAVRRLGENDSSMLGKGEQKTIAQRTERLAQAVTAVVIDYPSKIYMPEVVEEHWRAAGTPVLSRQQANGLIGLRESALFHRRFKPYHNKIDEIAEKIDDLPEIDLESWEPELRRFRLNVHSAEERQEIIDFAHRAAESTRKSQ